MEDFRNYEPEKIINLLKKNHFNEFKINNFFNKFNNQNIKKIINLKEVKDIDKISNILPLNTLLMVKNIHDEEKNEKFIFKTYDNFFIESVLMPNKKNISICVSVQVGCKLGCKICQTGKIGFKRNLYPFEILEQLKNIYLNRIKPERISCVSLMGMGEPFDNLSNTMTALKWISSNWGFKISRKKVTISTSGCIKFNDFFAYNKFPNLAISLHSANEIKRKLILPNSKISLIELKKYMLEYCNKTKNQISIEYCLIKNLNDNNTDAVELINYLKDIPCKINLLKYNPIDGCDFKTVSDETIENFMCHIKKSKIPVLYRKSLGTEIGAGCGQLGNSFLKIRS